MKRSNMLMLLAAIFIISLAVRLYFVFTTLFFSYDAYFGLRLVQLITEGNIPLTYDTLSYGGRVLLFPPLFFYLMSMLKLLLGEWALKLIPQLFMSSIPIIVFLSVRRLTQRIDSAFFSSAISIFIPIVLSKTLFTFTPLTLALPLTYTALLFIIYIQKKIFITAFITITVLLSLIHPSAIFLILGLIGYIAMSRLAGVKTEKSEAELVFFSAFVFVWIQFLLYKKAFLFYGLGLIQQNIPLEVISGYFGQVSLAGALLQIGILPIIGGAYTAYKYLFKVKNKYIYLYLSIGITATVITWLRLVEPYVGLTYMAISLCILSGPAYAYLVGFLHNIRFNVSRYYSPLLILVTVIGMVIPSFYFAYIEKNNTLSGELYDALLWVRDNSHQTSTVLATLKEGHAVTFLSNRKNVIDDNFLLIDDSSGRLKDVRTLYTSQFATDAIMLLEKYEIDYIMVSKNALVPYKINDVSYSSEECIKNVYENSFVTVYRTICRLGVIT